MTINKNIDATGTSWHGTTVRATLQELKGILGESAWSCSKTTHNWIGKTDDGQVFTVYDWKMGRFGKDQIVEWHIGGFNKEAEEKARNELLLVLG